MVNRFTVNGETYNAKPFDFEMMCELEANGVDVKRLDSMSMSLVRGYFAVCAGIDKTDAAQLIQAHVVNNGTLEEIQNAMAKEMDESDFFRALSQKTQEREEQNLGEGEAKGTKKERKPNEA